MENVKAAIRPETKAIYLETPSNPMMKVADIQAIAELAHAHGCILIVDNTFYPRISEAAYVRCGYCSAQRYEIPGRT